MNILLTGVNGLLGNSLASLLVKKTIMYMESLDEKYEKIKKVIYIKLDFSKRWSFKDLPNKLDTVIHLAQSNQFRNFPDEAGDVFKVNIESTARLLDFVINQELKNLFILPLEEYMAIVKAILRKRIYNHTRRTRLLSRQQSK